MPPQLALNYAGFGGRLISATFIYTVLFIFDYFTTLGAVTGHVT